MPNKFNEDTFEPKRALLIMRKQIQQRWSKQILNIKTTFFLESDETL